MGWNRDVMFGGRIKTFVILSFDAISCTIKQQHHLLLAIAFHPSFELHDLAQSQKMLPFIHAFELLYH
jgi:hypothetical protein